MLEKRFTWILTSVITAFSVSSGQVCSPRYPAAIPAPGGDDPSQDNGVWYAYRQNGDMTVNQIITVTNLGPTIDPLIGAVSYRQNVQRVYSTSAQNPTCRTDFTIQTYIVTGNIIGNRAATGETVIRHAAVNMLYHDYTNLVVAYGCLVPKADGTCDTPIIWAHTRVRSNQLTSNQMANFDHIISSIFNDYCITLDLLPHQIHGNSQASCPNTDPPTTCLGLLITGMNATVPAPTTTTAPYYGSPLSPTSAPSAVCKWPVTMPAKVNYDPKQHEGVWKAYRQIWQAEPTPINMQIKWHVIGASVLPLTNLTGAYMWVETTQYDSINATQCNFGYWTGFLTSSGENIGFRIVTTDGSFVPLRTTTVYADGQYLFYYGCVVPDLQSKTCQNAFGFFGSRDDPSLWSDSQKAHVDNDIITPLFKDYGCSAQDVRLMPHLPDRPLCTFEGGSTCVRQYNAGYSEIVQPASVVY